MAARPALIGTWRLFFTFAFCLLPFAFAANDASRFVVDDEAFEDAVITAAMKLKKSAQLLRAEKIREQLQSPRAAALKFAPPATEKLSSPDLYERVRQSTLAIGAIYQCTNCAQWHFNAAAGFVVSEDGAISTSYHVAAAVDEEADAKAGEFLVAADAAGRVFPVKEVLAADVESDTCLLRVEAKDLKPLALRSGARTGEKIFCLGHPDGNYFHFSEGMVARVHVMHDVLGADLGEDAKERPESSRPILCLNVTADFAPGSSGGPIVDEAGNVVAQVQSIANFVDDDGKGAGPTVIGPVRFCVAAEEILRLKEPRTPTVKPKQKTKRGNEKSKPKAQTPK